jgi:hypothetical protein
MAFDCLDLAARFEHDLIYIWPKAGDRPQPR